MVAISIKSATAPAVTSCEGGWGGASVRGRGFGTNVSDIGRRCCMGLWWNFCWRVAPVAWQARLGSLGRGGVGGLLQSWYGMRGLPRVAILDGGLGRRGKAGVGFCVVPVVKASQSGMANPCSCKSLAAVNAAWPAGGASVGCCNWCEGVSACCGRHLVVEDWENICPRSTMHWSGCDTGRSES